jgi:chemotaxis protein CheC
MNEERDSLFVDAIKEISNIAAGHLSKIISQLTKKEMIISIPDASMISVDSAAVNVGATGAPIFTGYTAVSGDMAGSLVVLFKKEDAITLTELVLNEKTSPSLFPNPWEKEALSEVIKITSGAYLDSMNQFFGASFNAESPIMDSFEAFKLLTFLENTADSSEDYARREIIGVSIRYALEDTDVNGEIMMLVGPTLLDYLKKEITEKY